MKAKQSRPTFHNDTLNKTTDERRDKFFEVATSEFAKYGYYGASINEIAKKSEISIGAMYKYFSSKEDIYLSVVNQLHIELENSYKPIMVSQATGLEIIEKLFDIAKGDALRNPLGNQIYHYSTTRPMEHIFKKVLVELEPLSIQAILYALNKIKEEKEIDFDEKMVSLIIDNLLIMCRLSFSSSYYKDRMALYLLRSDDDPYQDFVQTSMDYIKRMLLCDNV